MLLALVAFSALATVYLVAGSRHEEARLRAAYGAEYEAYRRSGVPFYWPRGAPHLQAGRTFRIRLRSVRPAIHIWRRDYTACGCCANMVLSQSPQVSRWLVDSRDPTRFVAGASTFAAAGLNARLRLDRQMGRPTIERRRRWIAPEHP